MECWDQISKKNFNYRVKIIIIEAQIKSGIQEKGIRHVRSIRGVIAGSSLTNGQPLG